MHIVFSTKGRERTIRGEKTDKLPGYLFGIAKNLKCKALAINGTDDHIHLLIDLPADATLAQLVNALKVNSSRWMKESISGFAWQRGYSAFSVSKSNVEAVKRYIANQKEHHKKMDYRTELIKLLKRHDVDFDERFVLD